MQNVTICQLCGQKIGCNITGRYEKPCYWCGETCYFEKVLPDKTNYTECNRCLSAGGEE